MKTENRMNVTRNNEDGFRQLDKKGNPDKENKKPSDNSEDGISGYNKSTDAFVKTRQSQWPVKNKNGNKKEKNSKI